MKRRRRGQHIADPLPAAAALELTTRLAGLEETLWRTSSELVRARDSRDKHKARARSLEAALAAELRRTISVIAEQASKTAMLREEGATLQRQLLDAAAGQDDERQTQLVVPPAAATAAAWPPEADGSSAKLRARLAEGNAAYTRLITQNEELRKTSGSPAGIQDKSAAMIERSWDRLCRKLYQASKGRPIPDTERDILSHWITWKNEQHHKKTQQQRKKAARK